MLGRTVNENPEFQSETENQSSTCDYMHDDVESIDFVVVMI